jgi:TRAP-type mannitol/chloroaromatic compound transport system substrate-binding protein
VQILQEQECQVEDNMSRQYDVLVKKSVHFNLTKDSHTALKMACTARSLSMQEVIEAFAKRIEIEDNKMIKFLDDVVEEKKHKAKKNFSKSDVESIFSMIEDED